MEDKLQLFYNSLTANPNIKGLPGDYELFRTTLADPGKSELFYNSLKANQNIKGMPESYDDFVTGLALNSGGITPKEPEQERPGFLEGLNKKFASSIYGAGEGITEAPQFGEAVKQLGVKTLADAYINRLVKKGKITAEQAEAEKKRTDTYLPKIDWVGAPHKAGTELPGTKMADSKANKWLSETSDRLSKEGTRYDERVVDYLKKGQFGKALGAEVYSITESLAPTLLAAFGGPVGAGALGVMTGAETYDEVKDREDMQEAAKVIDGLSTGVFEALFEYLGTAEMTKMLKNAYAKGTKEQVEEALKGSLGGLLSKAYKRFGVWLAPVHEGLSEGLTTLGQNATAKFTGEDPGRKINDNFIESVLIGMGMGGVFAGTEKGLEKLANKFKATPLDQGPAAIGELKVPYDQEQALEQINKIGRDFKFGDTLLEDDPNPVVSFAMTKLGQKVILKNEGGVNGDNFFIAFDVETSKPVLVKAGDIMERKDVPYQEWVNSELQNYNIVKAQGEKMTAQSEAPVQEGQEITIKDKNFYVSQVTPEGISLNEIDEKGNITGAALQIAPDQYNTVFGLDQGIQEEGNMPQNELPQATNEGIQANQAAPEAQAAPAARTLTVNKTNYQAIPDEKGILTIDQVFTDETTAKNALKALEKGYPKAAFSLQKTEFEDFLTPDEYKITIQPKQAAVKAEQPVVISEAPAIEPTLPQKSDVRPDVPDAKTEDTPSITPDETAPEEVKQKAGEMEKPTKKEEKPKESWQMTREEFWNQPDAQRIYGKLGDKDKDAYLSLHKVAIEEALAAGESVPPEVLADYPELQTDLAKVNAEIKNKPKRGSGRMGNGMQLSDEIKQEAGRLYQAGLTQEQVAKELSIGASTMSKILNELGIPARKFESLHNKKPQELKDEVLRLYVDEKIGMVELSERFNIGTTTIGRWLREAGVTRNLSEAFSNAVQQGRKKYKGTNLPWQSTKTNRWEFADSKWEMVRMSQLDADETVKSWTKLVGPVPYTDPNGVQRNYSPDFIIEYHDGRMVVEEIKPSTQLDTDITKAKTEAARQYFNDKGIEYEVITENEIGVDDINNFSIEGFASITEEERNKRRLERRAKAERERSAKKRELQKLQIAIVKANDEVNTLPTEKQVESGNYKKGHLSIPGFDITIENPAMSVRSGTDRTGRKWSQMLNNSYGYFRRTKGKDGDQVDVFLGDNLNSDSVYVIDQVDPQTGLFDEHKVMLGFNSAQDAKDNYYGNYELGWKGLGSISKMSIDQFKEWLGDGTRTKKPVDGNVPVQKKVEPKAEPKKPIKEVTLKPKKKGFTFGPNSRTGKVMAQTPNSFREAALQFFIGGGRIKTQDFLDHSGYKRGSREFRQYRWAFKNDGVRLDVFNEALDNSFGIEDQGPMDMINEVIDILRTYPGRGQMITALEKHQSVDKVPDNMLPPEEDPSLEYDDINGADEEIEEIVDDIMELPEVKEIVKQYSSDGILDVDKLLAGIEASPGEFTIFPFALKKSELLKLKERLQDEQRRRTQESQTRTDQRNQDQSKGSGENTPRSDQGNAIRTGREEGAKGTTEPAGGPEITIPGSESGDLRKSLITYFGDDNIDYRATPLSFTEVHLKDGRVFSFNNFQEWENNKGPAKYIETTPKEEKPEFAGDVIDKKPAENIRAEAEKLIGEDVVKKLISEGFGFVRGGLHTPKLSFEDIGLIDNISRNALYKLKEKNIDPVRVLAKKGQEARKPEPASPVQPVKKGPDLKTLEGQIANLKYYIEEDLEAQKITNRIIELRKITDKTPAQAKELREKGYAYETVYARAEELRKNIDNTIIPEEKIAEITKLIKETIAKNQAVGDRILNLQSKRDSKEKELQKRNELLGDRNAEAQKQAGEQSLFAGDALFAPNSENLQSALKPFNDAIKKAEEEWKRNDQLLEEQIDLVLKGTQQKLTYEEPETPVEDQIPLIEPQDKESLPKLEDFGEKIGGARKDLGITRKVRDTDSLPAWRRKYSYANADGTMIIGEKIDTSRPFVVQWAKEIDTWTGKRTRYTIVTAIDSRVPKIFNSEDEAEAYIPIYEVWKQNFRIRKSGDNYVITKTSSTGKAVEYATFPTEEDANVYMYSTEGATSLLNHKREDFSIPALDKVERSGKDWRKGSDISTEEFMNAFGFRGGEFGNWVKPEERRVMLNAAYDSFMDLAALLNIPPKALSFGGELSIAFGARGTKGAAAHFEPDRAVINLTRMNGAGSLAHEWAHALDNYFGLQGAKKDYSRNEKGEVKAGRVMRTEAGLLSIQGMRQQLSTIFDAIVEATQQKAVTRVMGIEEKQKNYDRIKKSVQGEADSLLEKFEKGVRRYQYNRKTKQREEVIVKGTPAQLSKIKGVLDKIIKSEGTKPIWSRIPGSKGMGEYSYISPETLALEELHKEVFGRSGLKRDGSGFYNLGYYADKMFYAKTNLDKALAGESETLNVPTDFLKSSKQFDKSRAIPYWSTKVEMFARAFEYFVETKLLDQNIRADYLQYDKAPVYEAIYGKNPYPSGEERGNLNNLFGRFFETIQTKEEDGKVALFRISEDLYFSPVEKALAAIKQGKATVQQWKAMLLKNGAKETELAWMGWDDFASIFEGTSDMNKDHIQTWINQNKVEIKEVGYGGEAKDDKYDQLLKDIDKAQEPILRFNALYGDYPYYNITTDKWVYKDEQGNIKDVPEKYMPDVLKWGEAKRALDDYIDDNTNIYGDFEVAGATKYSQYTLPGGEDYKELLLTMPGKPNLKPIDYEVRKIDLGDGEYSYRVYDNRGIIRGRDFETPEAAEDFKNGLEKSFVSEIVDTRDLYQSGHWDQPNILAHVRFNTRRSPDGKNILFIEEIQSDWAQTGKKKGFNGIFDEQRFENWYKDHRHSTDPSWEEYQKLSEVEKKEYRDAFLDELNNMGYVPDMPYKKTDQWAGLALRRMIRYAIDNGFDAVAWTPGEVQNERYDLSKQIDHVMYWAMPDGKYGFSAFQNSDDTTPVLKQNNLNETEIEDYLGKEVAQKIINKENPTNKVGETQYGNLPNANLKVGGSGMKGFYDNILPSIANKLGKKFGSQVGKVNIETVDNKYSTTTDSNKFTTRQEEDGTWTAMWKETGTALSGQYKTKEEAQGAIDKFVQTKQLAVHSLPITEAMFDSYRQGIPLFKSSRSLTGESLLLDVVSASPRENWENEVRDKVSILANTLNTKIEVINNRSQLPGRIQRQALRQGITSNKHISGVYDPQTDTVYVILDEIRTAGTLRAIEEVTKTVLHEVVAHQGLPSVLEEEEYNKLLDDLFWSIPQIDRSFLMEQYNTSNPRTISEEYLGMMAEQNVNPTLFQRVLAKIRQLIRKLFKVNYTENDIHYMLRRSRENLQKPKASDFNTAEEYLEAVDKRKNAKFRIAKAYKDNIVSQAAEVYKEKEARRTIDETKQGIREYIQDLNLPIRKFEEEVLKRGGKQDNESKPYRDTSLSFGRQEKLYNDFFDQKMKPVLAAVANIKKSGASGEEVLPYIICKHAIERNRVFREKELNDFIESHPEAGPDKINDFEMSIRNKDYSGVMAFDREGKYTNPDELAKDIASEFESQVDKKLINDLWSNLREANSEILDTWEAGQQISAEQKQEYLAKFKHFVPLRGWRDGAAKELRYTKGQGFSHSLRHAEGRKSLADNPLAYILNVEFQAIAEQVTNEVNSSMLNLIIRNLGNNEIHELATLKKLYYLKVNLPDGSYEWEPTLTRPTPEQFANDEARTRIFREHERLRAPSQAREHEVIVQKPGGDMVMIFKGKNLSVAQSLNKQNYLYRTIFGNVHDARDINKAMAFLGNLNNMLKAAYTSWNVVFPFTNFMRDFQEASITQAIKQGNGLKVIRNYKHTFPAIIRQMTGRQNLNNPIDRSLDEFYKAGGATGYTHLKTPEEIEKDINKEIKRMVRAGTLRGDMANTAHKFLLGIENWNRIFEDATRFSVYMASLSAGNTKEDAASDAKEASVNFNRKGKGSKAWDAYFAFFNVALQSMQKNFSLAKNYTGKFSAVALSFVTLGFLEAMMNALFDDDEDTSYYNINPYMRQNYLLVPNIPALIKGESKGDKYLSIPLPQFWRGFKSMGAIGFDIATKRMNVKDGIMHALGNFGSSLLPVDIGGLWKAGELSLAPIMPTVIKPIAEVIENRNYMGYAIKNEPFTKEQEKILAHAGLGKKNVSPAAKFITDMLFRWGGGDSKYKFYYDSYDRKSKKVFGLLDINPSTLEHLFKGYTGGTGAGFSDLITTITQGLTPEQDIDFRNMPFVNRFIRKVPEAKWNIISDYYSLRDDNKVTNLLSANYFKEGNYEKAMEIMGDEYLMRYTETFKHYESALDDAKKDVDFDDVEGNYRGIELMRQCINDIKDLKEQYGR